MLIIPSPPSCISINMTTFLSISFVFYFYYTTNPVTQVDVVAVNNAVTKSVHCPLAELTGNISINVPTIITQRNPTIIILAALNFVSLSIFLKFIFKLVIIIPFEY